MSSKKYNIISKLEDDAPYGNINWCTISFLTPQKIDKSKYLDVMGLKVHNGYNDDKIAFNDAKNIKKNKPKHDVYISQLGKIYAWDDATKTDEIEYDNQKLNDLEKSRRENMDKIRLMQENFKNEHKTIYAGSSDGRRDQTYKKLQKKLYERGLITQKEYEMIKETDRPVKDIKAEAEQRNKMDAEMNECKTDYLDENEPTGLKFGCLTVYSPAHIKGLKILCFKIRGIFQTMDDMNRRVRELEQLYPNDRIYRFEVGKWCAFSEKDNIEPERMLQELNYGMKCYLDNLDHEAEEFEKRKEGLQTKTEQEAKAKLMLNRREKRKEKLRKKKLEKNGEKAVEKIEAPSEPTPVPSMGNTEDDAAIQKIMNFLDDPELKNRFVTDKSKTETVTVDVSNS